MTSDEYDHLWVCAYCEQWFVVPALARWHEAKHEEQGE